MADLRIRIELQRTNKGIEMSKLADLARETQKLLRMIAEDVHLDEAGGTWVAQDFYNGSLGFDAEYQLADVDIDQVHAFLHTVDQVATAERETNWNAQHVRPATLVQSAKLATLAEEGETIRLGWMNGSPAVEWRPLKKDRAAAILEHFNAWVEYRGMLQGRIHALYKESNPAFFELRDFASGTLVKCIYKPNHYDEVYRALERRDAVALVAGWIRAKRLDRSIAEIHVERIQPTRPVDENRLREFFGSAPSWTGDMTTDQFIDSVRGRED